MTLYNTLRSPVLRSRLLIVVEVKLDGGALIELCFETRTCWLMDLIWPASV